MISRSTGYTIIEHTADLGIRVTAPTLQDLFVQAARGMYALLGDLRPGEPAAQREVSVAASDAEGLLHDWLTELLWAFQSAGQVYEAFAFTRFEPTGLTARCTGHVYDRDRSEVGAEIKAVTYHGLEIGRVNGSYEVTIIFDI